MSSATATAASREFRRLFEAEFEYVCRSLRRLGVREVDLADVAQELFVTVHNQLPKFDVTRPLRPWLFSFSLKFAANYRRLARNRAPHVEVDDASAAPADPNGEARDLVLRALADLDFDRRTVLVMHDLEGFGAPEIAEETGVPLNTVYSRLRHARAEFRAAVDRLQARAGSR
ncbi:sigma-70 family RNA polymerase sigma factor [soil metagenome]